MEKKNYNRTIHACFTGYIVQAIIVNFAPLLFVTFQKEYSMGLDRISFLITLVFFLQLLVDLLSSFFVDKIGYRVSAVLAQIFSACGLISLAVLPDLFADPYVGLLLATGLYAVGGGLIEVVVSPVVEQCPSDHKAATMSLLHSFYCWGQLFTVLASTIFFVVFGLENWKYLAALWAILPIVDGVMFCFVPLPDIHGEVSEHMGVRKLICDKRFWILALIMLCSGASELCISQWASAFAQDGLGVPKTVGDLTGPCLFAVLMGTARILYAKFAHRFNMKNVMIASGTLCIACYLLAALSPISAFGLAGCALAGFSVGVFWPCTLSLGAANIRGGGVALFALLALFGDAGCSIGPTLVGLVSEACGGDLHIGILISIVFPILLILGVLMFMYVTKKKSVAEHESEAA